MKVTGKLPFPVLVLLPVGVGLTLLCGVLSVGLGPLPGRVWLELPEGEMLALLPGGEVEILWLAGRVGLALPSGIVLALLLDWISSFLSMVIAVTSSEEHTQGNKSRPICCAPVSCGLNENNNC